MQLFLLMHKKSAISKLILLTTLFSLSLVYDIKIVSFIRQTSISQIVDNQAPSDGRMDVGRCQLPLPRFSPCEPVEKRFRETYISLTNK